MQADEVVSYAPGKFRINKTSFPVTLGSGGTLLADAQRQASEHCSKQGKSLQSLAETKHDAVPLDRYASARLLFECI